MVSPLVVVMSVGADGMPPCCLLGDMSACFVRQDGYGRDLTCSVEFSTELFYFMYFLVSVF